MHNIDIGFTRDFLLLYGDSFDVLSSCWGCVGFNACIRGLWRQTCQQLQTGHSGEPVRILPSL